MSSKMIKISATKAFKIDPIIIGEDQYMISIRQMYCTKKDPEWKPARQGITLPVDYAERIAKIVRNMAVSEDTEFLEISHKED